MMTTNPAPALTDFDLYLLAQSTHYRSYEKLGAHVGVQDGVAGTHFAVWAPNAVEVSVIGDFNGWNADSHRMSLLPGPGVWEFFIPGVGSGQNYKYSIQSRFVPTRLEKADPYAFHTETRPFTASRVWDLTRYAWGDEAWLAQRRKQNLYTSPVSIYEVHLGSWMRDPFNGNRWLTYRELAPKLADYVRDLGFTHVELLPITEHPYDGSWGYQTTGYFAPTSRFGSPDDFMWFVDTLHQAGIGVILDWVPAHFPTDAWALGEFDGSHLYEHADPRQGMHPDWGTYIFNYARNEVANFLIASALFWLDKYHIDGLRVDAVASMLYLDYGRRQGEWVPNEHGGRENLAAVAFLRRFNDVVHDYYPDVMTLAEESTSWPKVSHGTQEGGLGFTFKWNMGWMHDMLEYFEKEPVYRKYHHTNLTFGMLYQGSENYLLPLSHDEVVHLKKSLVSKMPGDQWQKFANLRLLYGHMMGYPGKKLLFMGGEFGQWSEWSEKASIDWPLLAFPIHQELQRWLRELLHLYKSEPALHEQDRSWQAFEWSDCNDVEGCSISYFRFPQKPDHDSFLFVFNFTPVPRLEHRVAVPWGGTWQMVLNSDEGRFGGGGVINPLQIEAEATPLHGRPCSLQLALPPLGVLVLKSRKPVQQAP
ncbi:MAG: 1,4-alpha-glucan branching protein GlgB [Candidatus Xenobia bacterium]